MFIYGTQSPSPPPLSPHGFGISGWWKGEEGRVERKKRWLLIKKNVPIIFFSSCLLDEGKQERKSGHRHAEAEIEKKLDFFPLFLHLWRHLTRKKCLPIRTGTVFNWKKKKEKPLPWQIFVLECFFFLNSVPNYLLQWTRTQGHN